VINFRENTVTCPARVVVEASWGRSRVKMVQVGDGTSNTILVVEYGARPVVYRRGSAFPSLSNDQGIS